jgi:hypothetical protein
MNAAARVRREKVRIQAAACSRNLDRPRRSLLNCGFLRSRCGTGGGDGWPEGRTPSRRLDRVARTANSLPSSRNCSPRCLMTAARARLGRRPLDSRAGGGVDRSPLRRLLYPARGVLSAASHGLQPAGSNPPSDRTGPGGDRELASQAVAVGKRLAATQGSWICFRYRYRGSVIPSPWPSA